MVPASLSLIAAMQILKEFDRIHAGNKINDMVC